MTNKVNRILLYVHFNKDGQVAKYVRYQLRAIRPLFHKVVFISNSAISDQDKKELDGLYDIFLQRENTGFDFAAWRDGMAKVGWNKLSQYDSATLMNDTCFGPIYPMDDIYNRMEAKQLDFWGLTSYKATPTEMPKTNGAVPEHIQSYSVCYGQNVLRSKIFQDFWKNIQDYSDVSRVIQDYETQLTGILAGAGFSYGAYFDAQKYSDKHGDLGIGSYSELQPLIIINSGVPLLKVKSFSHVPYKRIIEALHNKSNYPIDLITDHIMTARIRTISPTMAMLSKAKKSIARAIKRNKIAIKITTVARKGKH